MIAENLTLRISRKKERYWLLKDLPILPSMSGGLLAAGGRMIRPNLFSTEKEMSCR